MPNAQPGPGVSARLAAFVYAQSIFIVGQCRLNLGGNMLKIYGQARSRAYRVLWLCTESGIPFEHDPVSIHVPDATAKADWYRALNPNARVPTIDDDGFVMWESAAINLYLAKKYKSPLWPDSRKARGRAYQWGFFISNDVEQPMTTVFQNRVLFPPERRDTALADACDKQLQAEAAGA